MYQLVEDREKTGEDVKVGGEPGLDGDDVGTYVREGYGNDGTSRLKLEGNDVRHHKCCFPLAIIQILTCFVTSNTYTSLLFEGDGGSQEGGIWWWWWQT